MALLLELPVSFLSSSSGIRGLVEPKPTKLVHLFDVFISLQVLGNLDLDSLGVDQEVTVKLVNFASVRCRFAQSFEISVHFSRSFGQSLGTQLPDISISLQSRSFGFVGVELEFLFV